jgi:hypothetical protein
VLERTTPPRLAAAEPDADALEPAGDQVEAEPAKGRGSRRPTIT